MRACKVDDNQPEIVRQLRKLKGISVKHTHVIKGFCDLCIGYDGNNYLFEIKDPEKPFSKRKLTDKEKEFHDAWTGQIDTIYYVCEILDIINYKY